MSAANPLQAYGLDPYKASRMAGRAEMRDEILKVMSDAAVWASGAQADLLWDLIKETQRIALGDP